MVCAADIREGRRSGGVRDFRERATRGLGEATKVRKGSVVFGFQRQCVDSTPPHALTAQVGRRSVPGRATAHRLRATLLPPGMRIAAN